MDKTKALEILGDRFSFTAVDIDSVIQKLNLPPSAKILDVGTGLGNMAITLALNGYRVLTGEPGDDASIYAKQNWRDSAQKVQVDHLIEFKSFNAKNLPYPDGFFDAIFALGSLHHIEESERKNVLKEFLRASKPDVVICFFEPNRKSIEMIRQSDAQHPDAADPSKYVEGLDLTCQKIAGINFDAFIVRKQ